MYDVVIVGGGLAGLCSAIGCAERSLKTALISRSIGGELLESPFVSLPGLAGVSGQEIARRLLDQAKSLGVEIIGSEISSVRSGITLFNVADISNTVYKTKAVIIASGSSAGFLGVPGEDEFLGKGITTKPLFDIASLDHKAVAIIGDDERAARLAIYLLARCARVHIICHSQKLNALAATRDLIKKMMRIEVHLNAKVISMNGTINLESISLEGKGIIPVEGLVISQMGRAQTDFARHLSLKIDEMGCIHTDLHMRTNVKGVFAAGSASTHLSSSNPIFVAAHAQRAAISAYEFCNGK